MWKTEAVVVDCNGVMAIYGGVWVVVDNPEPVMVRLAGFSCRNCPQDYGYCWPLRSVVCLKLYSGWAAATNKRQLNSLRQLRKAGPVARAVSDTVFLKGRSMEILYLLAALVALARPGIWGVVAADHQQSGLPCQLCCGYQSCDRPATGRSTGNIYQLGRRQCRYAGNILPSAS